MLLCGGIALGRQMLLWGGKCCSGEANVALGELLWESKYALGRQMLLWGSKYALGRQMLLWGGKCCSGEVNMLWGGKCCTGRESLSFILLF
ncbi:MAG TPA: hypothetical protein PLB63_11765 [Planctomycetota bacterium]|nr:hypothetical protein [Planctomycetota bacterium]